MRLFQRAHQQGQRGLETARHEPIEPGGAALGASPGSADRRVVGLLLRAVHEAAAIRPDDRARAGPAVLPGADATRCNGLQRSTPLTSPVTVRAAVHV